mmetsp:Transcript_955/g.1721  ORF Transcript_955/g.1721 Transcript_955/m.1721 type:complete len:217 (-) Transcript_955:2132-2782(-)
MDRYLLAATCHHSAAAMFPWEFCSPVAVVVAAFPLTRLALVLASAENLFSQTLYRCAAAATFAHTPSDPTDAYSYPIETNRQVVGLPLEVEETGNCNCGSHSQMQFVSDSTACRSHPVTADPAAVPTADPPSSLHSPALKDSQVIRGMRAVAAAFDLTLVSCMSDVSETSLQLSGSSLEAWELSGSSSRIGSHSPATCNCYSRYRLGWRRRPRHCH